MKFIPIPPISLQEKFMRPSLFALAHLLRNNSYASFFREVAPTTFCILDNGMYEEQPIKIQTLVQLALDYSFAEIALPDVLRNDVDTLLLTQDALQYILRNHPRLYNSDTRFMLIPQGKTPLQWAICFEMLIEEHELRFPRRPFTIGVPKVTNHFIGGRIRLLSEYILPLKEQYGFQIHLLGIEEFLDEFKIIQDRFGDKIRSVDSARPFVHAVYGQEMSIIFEPKSYPGRPPNYFDLVLKRREVILAEQNVYAYERICLGDRSK